MKTFIKLFSNEKGEIYRFLNKFFDKKNYATCDSNILEWQQHFDNPIEMSDLIGVFVDNIDNFKITMWISLDEDILINVTTHNANDLIKYLYERFPY